MNAPQDRTQTDNATAADIARRQLLRESLGEWWERLANTSSAWDLEAVKHLVVLNAAGLAGVATLLARNKGLSPEWTGPVTLLGYGFGVVLAILNMYLSAVSFTLMANEVSDRIRNTWDLSINMDGMHEKPKSGSILNIAGQACGWASAILAVGSTVTIGISLVGR